IRCRSALARDAVCQATMMPLQECIRQQAGSYGRHSPTDTSFAAYRPSARIPPPIRHSPQIRVCALPPIRHSPRIPRTHAATGT
ncbi:hypothetical protein, partial [Pseudomonas sp. ME-P-057]|uniref:hypothetical protein n=1 Tax=Pseudomonas sp. ME-P-057 TaxID=3040321 RepID=UPI002552ADB4